MQSSRLVGTFLGPDNALGFGLTDWVELILLLLLIPALQFRPKLARLINRISKNTMLCFLIAAILPLLLRVALLPNHPVPVPNTPEEFSHLLVADTVGHLRLANPQHSLHRFFETLNVLQQPTYSSAQPLGTGLLLAFGRLLSGVPWVGIALSIGTFSALCYWMLLPWTTRLWALAGALLAVMQFGPLNAWMNSYSGGALPAIAGCLVFGALPRLQEQTQPQNAALLGTGLALQLLAQPCQFVLLGLSAAVFFALSIWLDRDTSRRSIFRGRTSGKTKCAAAFLLPMLPALGLTALQNKQVTGHWYLPPYLLSQQQYGVPASLTIQPNPTPTVPLTREQALKYKLQRSFHTADPDTLTKFFLRLEYRVRFYRFFLSAPLYLALFIFLIAARRWSRLWIATTIILFALGCNLFPYFFPDYVAALASLFILMSVLGLQQLAKLSIRSWPAGQYAATIILLLCIVNFCTFYGAHLLENHQLSSGIEAYETWDAIDHANISRRDLVTRQLLSSSGKQLILVNYSPNHIFQDEWVYNAADIDASPIVWARDLGHAENEKLLRYYPDRTVWLLQPDARPPHLDRYATLPAQLLDVK